MNKGRFRVRVFPDDESTDIVYDDVPHVFWEADNTVLTICLPDGRKHDHWLRERIRHYTVTELEDESSGTGGGETTPDGHYGQPDVQPGGSSSPPQDVIEARAREESC